MGAGRGLYILRVLGLIGRVPYHILQIFAALLGGRRLRLAGPMAAAGLMKRAVVPHAAGGAEPPPSNAQEWFLVAERCYRMKTYDKASAACLEAVRLRPCFSDAWGLLGNLYRVAGQLDDAETALNEAVRLNPEDAIAWADLGGVYAGKGDSERAIHAFERASRLGPPRNAARRWEAELREVRRGRHPLADR
jgi:cytochrome c-type biogenesis protein CcmH/NrfG